MSAQEESRSIAIAARTEPVLLWAVPTTGSPSPPMKPPVRSPM
jgi:hypothetical protein